MHPELLAATKTIEESNERIRRSARALWRTAVLLDHLARPTCDICGAKAPRVHAREDFGIPCAVGCCCAHDGGICP